MNSKKNIKNILDLSNLIILILIIYLMKDLTLSDRRLSYLIMLCIILYFFGRITDSSQFIEIYHISFAIIIFFSIFFFKNKNLILLHSIIIITAIATRKIFKKCIIRSLETKENFITNNIISKNLNWDYIFPILGLISNFRLYSQIY